jgi:hypothetical protein
MWAKYEIEDAIQDKPLQNEVWIIVQTTMQTTKFLSNNVLLNHQDMHEKTN